METPPWKDRRSLTAAAMYSITSWRPAAGLSIRTVQRTFIRGPGQPKALDFAIDCTGPYAALVSDPRQPREPSSRTSAKDVARLAGVSTATVSRVINSPAQVDD